jgi:hypothetical protein
VDHPNTGGNFAGGKTTFLAACCQCDEIGMDESNQVEQ